MRKGNKRNILNFPPSVVVLSETTHTKKTEEEKKIQKNSGVWKKKKTSLKISLIVWMLSEPVFFLMMEHWPFNIPESSHDTSLKKEKWRWTKIPEEKGKSAFARRKKKRNERKKTSDFVLFFELISWNHISRKTKKRRREVVVRNTFTATNWRAKL